MRNAIARVVALLLVIVVIGPAGLAAQNHPRYAMLDDADNPTYMGKPLSYWLQSIRDRDVDTMDIAFVAIRELGPDAWQAVPELTRIVAAPFKPIDLRVDGPSAILSKIDEIQVRADAIEALSAIGEKAASATPVLIRWALTLRVVPHTMDNASMDRVYVDLVAMDVLERMRVAGTVAQLGPAAGPDVVALLKSPDAEGRKLAVAILSEGALPIAAHLLKSVSCEDRSLGMAVLMDMWPVVARQHLIELRSALMCQDAD